MTDTPVPGRGTPSRLNVELGERLAVDVETLRRLIQDSLRYRLSKILGVVLH